MRRPLALGAALISMMREVPVLFNGAMVRAIQDDRKTQTRRIVKPQPVGAVCAQRILYSNHAKDIGKFAFFDRKDVAAARVVAHARSPLGKPGDRLWVRETWAWPGEEQVLYFADPWARKLADEWKKDPNYPQVKWKPSIHMPRRLARLFLDVLDVRIERLQDITDADAEAEGVRSWAENDENMQGLRGMGIATPDRPRFLFQCLWQRVYGAESWAANPWVWVTTFRKVP